MDRITELAKGLAADWWDRTAYRQLDLADMAEAYTVQQALQPLLATRRGPIAGRKIALSSKAMQQMVGIDQPIAGAFFGGDIIQSPAEVSLSSFRHMGIEAELAFTLARSFAPGDPLDDLPALIAKVQPAFELVEDKDADYATLDALSLVADNAWCGGVVLGTPIAGWQNLDLANLSGRFDQTGHPTEITNTGAADPWTSLEWLLRHVTGQGDTLDAGEVLITGSAVRTRFPGAGESLSYALDVGADVSISLT